MKLTPRAMPPKPSTVASDLLTHAKSVAALAKALDDVDKRAEALKEFEADRLAEWADKLAAAKKAFSDEEFRMEETRKRKRVDHELELKEHGREIAQGLLEEDGYVAIKKYELEELRANVQHLTEKIKVIEGDTEAAVRKELTKDHVMEMERAELKKSKITEQNSMLIEKVETLEKMCAQLRTDIKAGQDTIKCFAGRPVAAAAKE